ncbi:hypothetical protein TNCV_5115481 [Trichonephila clavipes]|nr:hypothetical protein TNCV_5115481 [Trichonephila clavipes]
MCADIQGGKFRKNMRRSPGRKLAVEGLESCVSKLALAERARQDNVLQTSSTTIQVIAPFPRGERELCDWLTSVPGGVPSSCLGVEASRGEPMGLSYWLCLCET